MWEVQAAVLLAIVMAAVLEDVRSGRIPNSLIATGLCCGLAYQICSMGLVGALLFMGGALLPLLFPGILYRFRMIGAGDVKLLCMAGGFLGPAGCFSCVLCSLLSGALLSLLVVAHRRNARQRFSVLADYLRRSQERDFDLDYRRMAGEGGNFCFSLPILFGVLCCLGGMI